MHEYSLMENILSDVLKELAARGIDRPGMVEEVHLSLGALEIHSRESFTQAYQVAIRGTPLAEATLVLDVKAGTVECARCGYEGAIAEDDADGHADAPVVECPKCGAITPVRGGRGVEPVELVLRVDA